MDWWRTDKDLYEFTATVVSSIIRVPYFIENPVVFIDGKKIHHGNDYRLCMVQRGMVRWVPVRLPGGEISIEPNDSKICLDHTLLNSEQYKFSVSLRRPLWRGEVLLVRRGLTAVDFAVDERALYSGAFDTLTNADQFAMRVAIDDLNQKRVDSSSAMSVSGVSDSQEWRPGRRVIMVDK